MPREGHDSAASRCTAGAPRNMARACLRSDHFPPESLGVTAIELMPVHPATDSALVARNGLTNYWGYASINFFAPDRRFASVPGRETHEFREMVRRFHSAGIEVLLDVVYNHSGEGDRRGPTVSFRGLDNVSYYRLRRDEPGAYEDLTGCGNTLDIRCRRCGGWCVTACDSGWTRCMWMVSASTWPRARAASGWFHCTGAAFPGDCV